MLMHVAACTYMYITCIVCNTCKRMVYPGATVFRLYTYDMLLRTICMFITTYGILVTTITDVYYR